MNNRYTIIIQWSHEDQCYVVTSPEWSEFCHTHGETYEAALKNAQESKVTRESIQGTSFSVKVTPESV